MSWTSIRKPLSYAWAMEHMAYDTGRREVEQERDAALAEVEQLRAQIARLTSETEPECESPS